MTICIFQNSFSILISLLYSNSHLSIHSRHFRFISSLYYSPFVMLYITSFTQFPSTSSYSHPSSSSRLRLISSSSSSFFFLKKISPYQWCFLYFLLHFRIFFIIFSFYYFFLTLDPCQNFRLESKFLQKYGWIGLRFERFFKLDLGSSGCLILFTCPVLVYKKPFYEWFTVNPVGPYGPIRV